MQISLVTPLFNRLDLTRACLESARRTLAGWDYEWIFLDDGSTDGTRDFLRALPDDGGRVRVVFNDAPRGFAANNNHGARLARAPLLCLLNNDLAFLPGWLEPMARLARALPDVACVGNVQREPVSGLIDHAGIFFDAEGEVRHAAKDRPAPPREDYLQWPAVTAACWVVRRQLFLDLGGFDEAFHNGGEDVDFCLRAGARGYRHFVANRSVVYHHVSASPGRKEGEDRNRQRFRERWPAGLPADLQHRRTPAHEREAGRRYLVKHRWQPWKFNGWRFCRALEQVFSPLPPGQGLDLAPRLWFQAQDLFFREGGWRPPGAIGSLSPQSGQAFEAANAADHSPMAPGGRHPPRSGPPEVCLVVGDTAQTADRTGVPTFVRSLAGACGRLGAPVLPVRWQAATGSLVPLPPEWSVGLDAETLRPSLAPSAAPLHDPALAEWGEGITDLPPLHALPPESRPPPGAWVILPEVLYGGRAEALLAYAHRHEWRLAVILHDALPNNEPAVFPLGIPDAHEAFLRAVAGADHVLPISAFTAADWGRFLAAKALPAPPASVHTPGADTFTRARGSAPATRTAPTPAPVRMLCVSGIRPRKNHRTLLAAFERVMTARPDLPLELTLIGKPHLFNEDNVPEALQSFRKQYPGKVRWIEWVEYSALRRLYEECDFTVFPSVLEGWAQPVVESLWFGKPCICADFGAPAEAASGGGCLAVDVRDPQALADAILQLAGEPGRLVAEGASRALKTWEEYAREVLAVVSKPSC